MQVGVARDSSGAVLPGVTVEAASPVLIEKVRTAVTDGSGQYRFTELAPGVYTVTFALPGFTTVRREDVDVSGVGVITINAEMRVGGLQETITVTGETPIVDVQSARRGATLTNDVIAALPATRGYNALNIVGCSARWTVNNVVALRTIGWAGEARRVRDRTARQDRS
jgi:hypothetical protein